MTTRSFLKSMLLAAVAPQILLSSAADRCVWKSSRKSFEFGFKPKEYYGEWKFVQYHKTEGGIWVKSGTGIDGVIPCDNLDVNLCQQWEILHPRPMMPISLSSGNVDMVFHKRDA